MMLRPIAGLGLVSVALLVACGDDDASSTTSSSSGGAGQGGAGGASGGASSGGAAQGGSGQGGGAVTTGGGCVRAPGPDDKDRFVVVGHPFDTSKPDGTYGVLALSQAGVLSATSTRFEMRKPVDREMAFTPDGVLGFAVQDDGTVGEFTVDATGNVTVLDAGYGGAFYADAVRVSDDGSTLYVVDPDFPDSGGGIYAAPIFCDGTLGDATKLFDTKNARAYVPLGPGSAAVVARAALGSTDVAHAHLVSLAGPTLESSANVFGDDEAILASFALTHDGKFLLVGDNSSFASTPNRVGVVGVGASSLTAVDVLADIEDPYALATSPFDDAAIVVSGFGDAIFVLGYAPGQDPPFSNEGELAYVGGSPQVPGSLTMLARGTSSGRVFIGDVRGVYQVEFAGGGNVTDLGILDLGGGNENIVAGIGVQP
ncbi:MAG TPA: hypothetical protein VL400_27250 [Polyangiaceae bacterium]|nr:hypothetical protein [Polyangiaceae bacterium]